MKFKGYVYVEIEPRDFSHLFKQGIKFPHDYEVSDVKMNGGLLVLCATGPDIPDSKRFKVEAVRCDNGFFVRRWNKGEA